MVWINKDLWKINEKSCCCQLSHSPASKEEANGGTAGEQTLCSCFSHCSLLHNFACESYKSFELIWAVIQRITVLLTKVCISTIPGYEQDSLLLVQACWPDAQSFSRHKQMFQMHLSHIQSHNQTTWWAEKWSTRQSWHGYLVTGRPPWLCGQPGTNSLLVSPCGFCGQWPFNPVYINLP